MKRDRIYFDTTKSPDVARHTKRAATQNKKLLAFFELNPRQSYTAWQVEQFHSMLIGSVRRTLHTLEKQKKIIRTGEKRPGKGHENFTYKLRK